MPECPECDLCDNPVADQRLLCERCNVHIEQTRGVEQ